MYLITLTLRQNNHTPQFHYDQFKDADSVLKRYDVQSVEAFVVEDDYGSGKAVVSPADIAGIFLTELDREMAAQEIAQMAKIQSDLRLRKKVSQDPSARLMVPNVAGNSW